ncbi:actin cytoskeleton-regulatory complex protein PAN1-like [Homalodisca vitripennis]|nr:actin cytoskeleton-regulatory complex protein PAN1-like [Homalodisca vitripennis]
MPHCASAAKLRLRRQSVPSAPWVSLRSRGLSVCLRSRTVKRLAQAPPVKRRPRKKKKRLPPIDPIEEEKFLYGHAFDVLLALGLVPSQDRIKQEDAISLGLNRMHVMEGECDQSSEMVAESAPDLVSAKATDIKLSKEELPQAEQLSEVTKEVVKSPESDEVKTSASEPEQEVAVNGESQDKGDSVGDLCVENGKEEDRTKVEPSVGDKEGCQRYSEGRASASASAGAGSERGREWGLQSQSRKRAAALVEPEGEGEGSSSESDGGSKRPRLEGDDGEDERERLVREYVEECTESMEDMSRAADKLHREIGALGELLRAKELEWNSILRLRKLKEEMLERLLRRRRLAALLSENNGVRDDCCTEKPVNKGNKQMNSLTVNSMPGVNHIPHNNATNGGGGLMMVPIVSSSPSPAQVTSSFTRGPPAGPRVPEQLRGPRLQRPILPKPGPGPLDHNSIVGEGRQGAILDVKSIIADYRSRHPENVPRRGRRMRPHEGGGPPRALMEPQPPVVSSTRISGSPALMSMANMALGSGSHVRENPGGPSFMGQENSRPSSADSSRSGHHLEMLPAPGLSFKDALVQFAKMSQPSKPPPPPPPYPEVTLHPVSAPHSPPPPHTSLLHGILTKSTPPTLPAPHQQPHRATTFSPTLARLLTAPERTPPPHTSPASHFRPPASRVNICEILSSSKKNRNEITITPVSGSNKTKDDVVLLPDDDEENDGDRLVIDEGRDTATNSELPENVPECQGCHQRAAQFVCAGCGNQWYCSRECQVSAWEDHSEMCSG